MSTSTHIFRIDGMHCGNCSLLIDDTLEDLPGVSGSHTEVKVGRSTVQLDTSLTDTREVIDTITGLGYTASVQQ
jgi:copper chaperone